MQSVSKILLFLQTERMIQGIQGFLDFTNTMVGEDITEMEKTNSKLRSHLPSKEQKNIESVILALVRPNQKTSASKFNKQNSTHDRLNFADLTRNRMKCCFVSSDANKTTQ